MTGKQVDEGSTDVKPKVIVEGRSGNIEGEKPGGSSIKELIDDDR